MWLLMLEVFEKTKSLPWLRGDDPIRSKSLLWRSFLLWKQGSSQVFLNGYVICIYIYIYTYIHIYIYMSWFLGDSRPTPPRIRMASGSFPSLPLGFHGEAMSGIPKRPAQFLPMTPEPPAWLAAASRAALGMASGKYHPPPAFVHQFDTMDWFKGKIYRKPWFLPSKYRGFPSSNSVIDTPIIFLRSLCEFNVAVEKNIDIIEYYR